MMGCLDFYMLIRSLLYLTPIFATMSNVQVVPSRRAVSYYMPSVSFSINFRTLAINNINNS